MECTQQTLPEDIQIQECPHDDDLDIQPQPDTTRGLEDGMPAKRIVSPYGGGMWSLPGATPMPVPPAERPQLGPWQEAVVRVEETPARATSSAENPYATPWTERRALWTDSLQVEHSGISTDILLFSELGLSLTQHYRVYKGGLPHAVFRMDYIERLRSLLQSLGQPGSTPPTGRGSTPKSVRRLHRSLQPRRLLSEAVDDGPLLTLQNPADVVGETVFDCQPSVLPVSIPLSGLSPGTVAEARESISFQPSEETGKSIMDMDTNEITISRIVGFEWDEPGTDLRCRHRSCRRFRSSPL